MKEIKIKSETTAKRCEICHLEDQFDPEKNICNRCVNVVVPKNKEAIDLGSKYKGIWGWISLFWINTTFFNPLGATWQVISDYRDYSEYFETYPSVFACCVSTNILSVAIASFGVYSI